MKWIGLTGSIGSGKSTVAELLRRRGKPVLDADQFSRQALSPGSKAESQIISIFGREIVDAQGHLDRKKLGSVVFSDRKKLTHLESIVHPLVQERTQSERTKLKQGGHPYAFYDVPLLFEKKLELQFDAIVVVFADLEKCVKRVVSRSSLSREEVEARVRSQLAIEEKIKRAHWVVHNNGSASELEHEVDKLIQDIGRKFGKSG